MLALWFSPKGEMTRESFFLCTLVAWLAGSAGFLALALATSSPFSFEVFGRILDRRGQALDVIFAMAGPGAVGATLLLWLVQIWALTVMSVKRLRGMGQSAWFALLSLAPGVKFFFWLTLCAWPSQTMRSGGALSV